ncbi:MAG: tRNA pseudouridine(38-40) synthase TruA [Verrucomicrobiota bacterium]
MPGLKRYKAVCAYDGTGFSGWQSQPAGNTVQDFLEARLGTILQTRVRIHGSGRTDAGVHARAQVFHFDAAWTHPVSDLLRALRSGLPAGIQVLRLSTARSDFHARYSATAKRYRYQLYEGYALPWETRYCWSLGNRKLDTAAMETAASSLIGEHDFTAFGANRGDGSEDNPVKDMRTLSVKRQGAKIRITYEASGFLYKMARSLTGTLVEVGLGKVTAEQVAAFLQNRQRNEAITTAPAQGLWLERVFY